LEEEAGRRRSKAGRTRSGSKPLSFLGAQAIGSRSVPVVSILSGDIAAVSRPKVATDLYMIHVSEKAAAKIRELLTKEGVPIDSGGLRVGVQGGGCSGLTYAMRLDTEARNRDKVFEENGARIFVDPKSYLYLHNTTLDYLEDLMKQGFVFQNPQATRSCGCGSSFTA
jgi:iron-sulfur cluster assembly protein